MCSKSLILSATVCALLASVCASSSIPDGSMKKSLSRDCDSTYSLTCFKLDIIGYLEKISTTDAYDIVSGVSVVKENDLGEKNAEIIADMARSFPNDPDKRLDGFIIAKITSYLQTHVLRLKFLDDSTAESTRSVFTARKGGKIGGGKKGGMEAMLAAAMMMKGTMGALALGALAMIAGKALLTGLMALMLSAIVGLKSLTSGGGSKATYEIVAKPMYSHSTSHSTSHDDHAHAGHTGYGSGYGRSLNFVLPEHLTKE